MGRQQPPVIPAKAGIQRDRQVTRRGEGCSRLRTLLLIAGLALLSLFVAACGGGGGPEEFMRMLSDDATRIAYSDIAAISDDGDLRQLRRAMESAWPFEPYYIDLRDLDYVASSVEGSDPIVFFGGFDDLDGLRDELDDLDYDDDEYRDVEVWVNPSSQWESFAFLPGGNVLAADYEALKDLLRRRDRGGTSLYDDIGDLWSSLPSGVMRGVYNDCNYRDCDFVGWSIAKEDSRDFKYVWTFEFESDRDAQRGLDDIEDDFGLRNADDRRTPRPTPTPEESVFGLRSLDDPRMSRDGRRVAVEMILDLDEIIDSFPVHY
jgi:hypothetical protein